MKSVNGEDQLEKLTTDKFISDDKIVHIRTLDRQGWTWTPSTGKCEILLITDLERFYSLAGLNDDNIVSKVKMWIRDHKMEQLLK